MKNDHLDILFMEKAARKRGMSFAQLQAAIRAYNSGGYSARKLLHTLGLLPKEPEKEPEMDEDELLSLQQLLHTPDVTQPPNIPDDPKPAEGARNVPIAGDCT